MKKICFVWVFFLASCGDLLNPKPQDGVLAESYFSNIQSADASVIAIYNILIRRESYLHDRLVFVELLGANIYPPNRNPPPFQDTYTHNLPTSAVHISTLWSNYYTAIGRANNALLGMATMKGAEALYGETAFLRAFMYFDLVRLYGDVPLVLEPTQTVDLSKIYLSRTPKTQIYNQIIKDLQIAEAQCPADYSSTAATKGRATKWAAKMLLAKVYLYTGNYAEAEKRLAEIEASKRFQLVPINGIFKVNNSPESLWELQITSNVGHANAPLLPRSLGGSNQLAVDPSLLRTYESNDLRLTNYLLREGPQTYVVKYQRNNAFQTDNIVLMRYAETLLTYAEVLVRNSNQIGDKALALLNAVRNRAGLAPKKVTDFKNTEAFLDEILWEKRRELVGECGETWFDLVRTDKALDLLKLKSRSLYVLPIPDAELRNNPNLTQNEGY
jgi:starch-binding outer membrane protein, SusD/RagB family